VELVDSGEVVASLVREAGLTSSALSNAQAALEAATSGMETLRSNGHEAQGALLTRLAELEASSVAKAEAIREMARSELEAARQAHAGELTEALKSAERRALEVATAAAAAAEEVASTAMARAVEEARAEGEEKRVALSARIKALEAEVEEANAALGRLQQQQQRANAATAGASSAMLHAYQQDISSLKVELELVNDAKTLAEEKEGLAREAARAAEEGARAAREAEAASTATAALLTTRAAQAEAECERLTSAVRAGVAAMECLAVAETALEEARGRCSSLEAALEKSSALAARAEEYEESLRSSRAAAARIAEENATLALESTRWENKISEAQGREAAARAGMEAAREELTRVREATASALSRKDLEISSLNSSLERLGGQCEAAGRAQAGAEARAASLVLRLGEREAELVVWEDRLSALNAGMGLLKENSARELAATRGQVEALEESLKGERRERGRVGEEGERERRGRLAAEEECTALQRACMEERRQGVAARGRAAAAEALAAARGSDLVSSGARCEAVSQSLREAQGECARLAARVEKLSKAKLTESQVRRMLELKREHESLTGEVATLRAENAALARRAAGVKATAHAEGAAAREAEERAVRAEEASAAAGKAAAASALAAREAQSALEDAKAAAVESSEELDRFKRKCAELGERLALSATSQGRLSSLGAVLGASLTSATSVLTGAGLELPTAALADNPFPSAVAASTTTTTTTTDWDAPLASLLSRARSFIDSLTARALALHAAHAALAQALSRSEASGGAKITAAENGEAKARGEIEALRAEFKSVSRELAEVGEARRLAEVKLSATEGSLASAFARAAAAEKSGAEALRSLAEKTRSAADAASEHARACAFLEKENLTLIMELRALRSSTANAPAVGVASSSMAASGVGGPRLSLAYPPTAAAAAAAAALGPPHPPRLTIGGGRMSLASSSRQSIAFGAPLQQQQQQSTSAVPAPPAGSSNGSMLRRGTTTTSAVGGGMSGKVDPLDSSFFSSSSSWQGQPPPPITASRVPLSSSTLAVASGNRGGDSNVATSAAPTNTSLMNFSMDYLSGENCYPGHSASKAPSTGGGKEANRRGMAPPNPDSSAECAQQ